jgi:hypothetical protein
MATAKEVEKNLSPIPSKVRLPTDIHEQDPGQPNRVFKLVGGAGAVTVKNGDNYVKLRAINSVIVPPKEFVHHLEKMCKVRNAVEITPEAIAVSGDVPDRSNIIAGGGA